jgi:hypothetical protein
MLKSVLEPKQTMAVCCPRYDNIALPSGTIHIQIRGYQAQLST